MIPINDFYAVLNQNLVKPLGIDSWYFFPDGTWDQLRKFVNSDDLPGSRYRAHVLFHDQEPIDSRQPWHDYDLANRPNWTQNCFRVLANSEHSSEKKKICRHRCMLDWYFFYHGFAALDWYRGSRYYDQLEPIVKPFLSFNHLIKGKRSYRMALTARLWQMNLIQHCDISFHGDAQDCADEIRDSTSLLPPCDRDMIAQHLCRNQELPLHIDSAEVDGDFSAHFCADDYRRWQRSMFHLVNETVFYEEKLHLTEKIFKPIVAQRPFFLVAAPGNLAYLQTYGFKTFSRWIDESYDAVSDPTHRLDKIAAEVKRLCDKPMKELLRMYEEMRPVLEFNKQHFFGNFRRHIVEELVDNFDACIKIWNNGRVDEREVAWHPDLGAVKQLLLK